MQEKLTPQLLGENWEPLITDNFDGCLNFDDTVLDKIYGKNCSLQYLQYSGHEHKVIRHIELVNCVYVNPKTHYFWVIDYQIFDHEGDGKTKIDHLL